MKKILCFVLAVLLLTFSFSVMAEDTVKADLIANLKTMIKPYFGNGYNYAIEKVLKPVDVTEDQASQVVDRFTQMTKSVSPRGENSTLNSYSYFEMLTMYSCVTDCCEILNIQHDISLLNRTCTLKYNGKNITDTVNMKGSTCTKTGYSGDVVCPVCFKVYTQGQVTPKAEHTPSGWIIESEATYETDGLQYMECLVCDERFLEEVIPKLQILLGDATNDGSVNVADAVIVAKHNAGISTILESAITAADVNGNGKIDIIDAIVIARFSAGLIEELKAA